VKKKFWLEHARHPQAWRSLGGRRGWACCAICAIFADGCELIYVKKIATENDGHGQEQQPWTDFTTDGLREPEMTTRGDFYHLHFITEVPTVNIRKIHTPF
jgi:hypothetical protein